MACYPVITPLSYYVSLFRNPLMEYRGRKLPSSPKTFHSMSGSEFAEAPETRSMLNSLTSHLLYLLTLNLLVPVRISILVSPRVYHS